MRTKQTLQRLARSWRLNELGADLAWVSHSWLRPAGTANHWQQETRPPETSTEIVAEAS